jgi:hypothetical protein
MSKEAAMAEAAQGPSSENLVATLRRLHREYLLAVRELAAEGERKVNSALEDCMAEMAKIEDDATTTIRQASTECESAIRATKDTPTSLPYWDYQRKVAETTTAAGSRADTARRAYLDAWRSLTEELTGLRHKVRVDYLARVQQAWRAADLEQVDQGTAEVLVQAFDNVFNELAIG